VGLVQHPVLSVIPLCALIVVALWGDRWTTAMKWTCTPRVGVRNAATHVVVDAYKYSEKICNCQKFYYLCKMKQYKNKQLSDNLKEVTDISKKVCANTRGIRLTVSPISAEVMTVTDLTHILDVGEEYSFFYTNEKDAIADQTLLCTHLRIRGIAIAKVIKQQPISLKLE